MAYDTIVAGTVITASWANQSARDQVITPFSDAGARSSAISSPVDGMLSTLTTTDRLDIYNGLSWSAVLAPSNGAWTSYTPTLGGTGWALGNGTATGRYMRAGRLVLFSAEITFGTTSTFGAGGLTVSVPVTSASGHRSYGWARALDAGSATYPLEVEISGSTATPLAITTGSTYVGEGALTTSVPHAWASGDILRIGPLQYQADTDG